MPSRSQRGPVVRQLGNGRAVSGVGRLIRQRLRSTRAHARTSTRAHAPTVHTPAHISMILHKHDTSTFLHLQTDMLTSQRRERARRTSQGTARRAAAENTTLRAAARPTTTSTRGIKALCNGIATCLQERCRARTVELQRAACLNQASKATHARPQHASMRQRRTGARGAAAL